MGAVKSVYLSPEEALGQMVADLQESGSPITDLSAGSAARSLLEAAAIVYSGQSRVADQLKQDSYLETAEGEALDALAQSNWSVPRLPAVKATGRVKITRQETADALLLSAGWGQLTVPPSSPGGEGVAVLTTEDASFEAGQTSATVTAVAVAGGPEGDLGAGTKLTPSSAVLGISSQEGYEVAEAFKGGVSEESDEAYRARVPLVVQGRQSKGTAMAFQAAALSIPGVLSVGVLKAGMLRANDTQMEGGHVEVVYQGAASLLSSVEAGVAEASVVNQEVTALCAESLEAPRGKRRVVLEATIVVEPGVSTEATGTEAAQAAMGYVNATGMGGTARLSSLVEALHAIGTIVSIALPLTRFAPYGETGAADISSYPDQYLSLAEADVTITVTELES